ncbi:hypothetical protein AGMMS50239_36690 [Bacteroidia bacterium]|nr:hypothetical protein AGMMS50239_36690 [Bacteroidia bacterium]
MNYKDFLYKQGFIQEDLVETDVKYDKGNISLLLALWYVIDTYYNSNSCACSDENLTLKIKSIAEDISKRVGGCEVDLPYIPYENLFYFVYEQDINFYL